MAHDAEGVATVLRVWAPSEVARQTLLRVQARAAAVALAKHPTGCGCLAHQAKRWLSYAPDGRGVEFSTLKLSRLAPMGTGGRGEPSRAYNAATADADFGVAFEGLRRSCPFVHAAAWLNRYGHPPGSTARPQGWWSRELRRSWPEHLAVARAMAPGDVRGWLLDAAAVLMADSLGWVPGRSPWADALRAAPEPPPDA